MDAHLIGIDLAQLLLKQNARTDNKERPVKAAERAAEPAAEPAATLGKQTRAESR